MTGRADADLSVGLSPIPPGTNINVFIFSDNSEPLLSVDEGTNNVPFIQIYYVPGVREIDEFQITIPADVLTNSVTLMWTNFSSNVPVVSQPYFAVMPQNQSVFVGGTATFAALATHTSGYQWQLNGTNLANDGHFFDVTNSVLTVSNIQMTDAGNYTVIAWHPLNPATSSATLSVYKPVVLGLGVNLSVAGFTLTVANQDGSAFESNRVSNLQIYSTTDLSLDPAFWNLETNIGTISNGVLQIDFPADGSANKFWRLLEQ
jgi:hypothetical protein